MHGSIYIGKLISLCKNTVFIFYNLKNVEQKPYFFKNFVDIPVVSVV